MNKTITTILANIAMLLILAFPAGASIWGTSAIGDLTGNRAVGNGNGLTVTGEKWGNISISWRISQLTDGKWEYVYDFNGDENAVSHFILEITQLSTSDTFNFESTVATEGPKTWSPSQSNPGSFSSFWGIKFDDNADNSIYTLVTDRAPVWGVFYAKGGKDNGVWSNALNSGDYKTNTSLTTQDFIVRPNGSPVPVPSALLLLGPGVVAVLGLRSRQNR